LIFDFAVMPSRKIIYTVLIFLSGFSLAGQIGSGQTKISLAYPVYSQYLHNGLIINPAYAGSREVLSFFLSTRLQWMGIKGAPVSETFSLHTLLKNDKVGLGLSGQFFQFGFTKSTSVYTDYAYHLVLGRGKLSMGLRAGFDMSNTNYSGIVLIDPNDPAFTVNDKPYFLPNVGAGLYYYNKSFFLGASIPSFLSYVKNSAGAVTFSTFKDFDVILTAGALISFSPAFKFKPSVLVDYPVQKTKKMRIDLNGNFIIYDFVWIGGSWRTSEEVAVGIIQLQVTPQIMFGYSYDYPVGNMNTYSKGSHEIIFRYEFGYKVSAANPRYF
jgi:type IX secretion system PorP/SprF family membrane protein